MFVYLILIITFGLLILTAIAIIIFGVVKKRKSVIIAATIVFITGAIGTGFSAVMYTKKVVSYVRSS